MKKNKNLSFDRETIERIVTMAQEERNPFEIIKKDFGISEKETTEIMRKQLSKDNFELWKKKVATKKLKPKPPAFDDLDDDLDVKYYIKNKFD